MKMRNNYRFAALILCVGCLMGVNLFGEALRASSDPFISGDSFRAICDYIFDETTQAFDPALVKRGDAIFVKTDMLPDFFVSKHPYIRKPYILVSHNSDGIVSSNYEKQLNDPKIIAWFAQNVWDFSHSKLRPIPIGVANRYWGHGDIDLLHQHRKQIDKEKRKHLLYLNFAVSNYPSERKPLYELFKKRSFCNVTNTKGFSEYLNDLLETKFVLCPRGNGPDCHRTWEALYMGAIPIVKSSSLDQLYEGLPVLIVQDWKEIDKRYLEQEWNELQSQRYGKEKLFFPYWASEIKKIKERYEGR